MSDRRLFLSQVFIYGLFALSLDLILGYAGILSLGHAAFFGVGAYTAGLLARHGWPEPLSGLGAAGLVAGAFGYAVSFLVVRGADLTRLMVTLGIGLLTAEAANQASSITGGVDGLADMQPATLFGTFSLRPRRQDRVSLQLRRPGADVRARAPARSLAVRSVAARDPRERAAHARHRRGCAPARCAPSSRSRPRWPAWPARCWRRPRASSASTRSASSAPPSCSSSWRSAARGASTARCSARPSSSWRRTCSPGSAPRTGSSGWAPCWSSWCWSRPAG